MPEYPLLGHSDYSTTSIEPEEEPWWKRALRAGVISLATGSPEFALSLEQRRRQQAQYDAMRKAQLREQKLQRILDQINKDSDRYEKERKDRDMRQKLVAAEERAKTAAATVTPETALAQGEQPYYTGQELAAGPMSSAERAAEFEQQMAMRPGLSPQVEASNIEQSALATRATFQPPTEEKPKRITREDWHMAWSELLESFDGDTDAAWAVAPPNLKRAVNLYFPSESPEKREKKTKKELEGKLAAAKRKLMTEWQNANLGVPTKADRQSRWFNRAKPNLLDIFSDEVYADELAPLLDYPEYRSVLIEMNQMGPPIPPGMQPSPQTEIAPEAEREEVSEAEANALLEELRKTRELLEKLEAGG